MTPTRCLLLLTLLAPLAAATDPGQVVAHEKLSDTFGGLSGSLADGDLFGTGLASPGDLDGDGLLDLAVGAPGADAGRGELWLLNLGPVGAVLDEHLLGSADVGGLPDGAAFGTAVAALGDLDGDDVPDLAVGAPGAGAGTVYVLLLDGAGGVKTVVTVAEGLGGFAGDLDGGDAFGSGLSALGDLDGDGHTELAVGAPGDDDGKGPNSGAVWVLFMQPDGGVAAQAKISDAIGDFGGILDGADRFGSAVAGLGDLDGDGHPDLAVGAPQDDDPVTDDDDTDEDVEAGAVWILFLDSDASVLAAQKISNLKGGLSGCDWDDVIDALFESPGAFDDVLEALDDECLLDTGDRFGSALSAPGDLDGDGVLDLVVGLRGDDDAGLNKGALQVLFLRDTGTVRARRKISAKKGKFGGKLDKRDHFGSALAVFDPQLGTPPSGGDASRVVVAVGAPDDDDGGSDNAAERGAVWLLNLKGFEGVDDFDGALVPGGKVKGAVTAGGRHGFDLELVAGSTLSVMTKRTGGAVEPATGVSDPDDAEVAAPADSVVKPGKAKLTKLAVDATGSWHVELENPADGGGYYTLRTKVKQPLRDAQVFSVPAPVPFEAAAGWTLRRLEVSAKKVDGVKSSLLPLVALRGPDGELRDIAAATQVKGNGSKVLVRDVELDETGTWQVEVTGDAGTSGGVRVAWRLRALEPDGVLEVFEGG